MSGLPGSHSVDRDHTVRSAGWRRAEWSGAAAAARYQVKAIAAVQMSSAERWPRNSLLRKTTLTSSRNDFDQIAEKPACRSPTRTFLGTLGLARNELPSRKMLRATARPWAPAK